MPQAFSSLSQMFLDWLQDDTALVPWGSPSCLVRSVPEDCAEVIFTFGGDTTVTLRLQATVYGGEQITIHLGLTSDFHYAVSAREQKPSRADIEATLRVALDAAHSWVCLQRQECIVAHTRRLLAALCVLCNTRAVVFPWGRKTENFALVIRSPFSPTREPCLEASLTFSVNQIFWEGEGETQLKPVSPMEVLEHIRPALCPMPPGDSWLRFLGVFKAESKTNNVTLSPDLGVHWEKALRNLASLDKTGAASDLLCGRVTLDCGGGEQNVYEVDIQSQKVHVWCRGWEDCNFARLRQLTRLPPCDSRAEVDLVRSVLVAEYHEFWEDLRLDMAQGTCLPSSVFESRCGPSTFYLLAKIAD